MNDDHEAKVALFTQRLLREFPDWSWDAANHAARRIVETGEQMEFQLCVERDLRSLPVTTDRRAA